MLLYNFKWREQLAFCWESLMCVIWHVYLYVGGVYVCVCVCVCACIVWFLASIGDMFCFLPSKLRTHRQTGYLRILVRALYSITEAIGCVEAPHLYIGVNVAICPVKV